MEKGENADFREMIVSYVQSRDSMLACMEAKRMPDCTACGEFVRCETRKAWGAAYNDMNRVVANPPTIKCRRCGAETNSWVYVKAGPEAFLCEKCVADYAVKITTVAENMAKLVSPECSCGEDCGGGGK